MSIVPHILFGSGGLIPFGEQIKKEFSKSVIKITEKIPVSDVDVVIYDNPEGAIPGIGIGGYTPNSHLVFISLDPQFSDFDITITKELKRALAHELHHTLRWQNPGYGATLLEALVTEGLADHFDLEINEGKPQPWCTALKADEIDKLLVRARIDFNKNYDHNSWFFGSKEKGIPKWSGYSLGFKMVKNYLKKYPEKKPSTLYAAKATSFI